MAKLTGASPAPLTADVGRAVSYYRDRFGFDCDVYAEPPDFVFREFDVQDPDGHDIAFGQRR